MTRNYRRLRDSRDLIVSEIARRGGVPMDHYEIAEVLGKHWRHTKRILLRLDEYIWRNPGDPGDRDPTIYGLTERGERLAAELRFGEAAE